MPEVLFENIDLACFEDFCDCRLLGGDPGVPADFTDRARDTLRPMPPFRRGSSDMSCRAVETRWIRGSSGPSRPSPVAPSREPGFLATMNPYLSISAPSRSAQSSSPPAVSVGSLGMWSSPLELTKELESSRLRFTVRVDSFAGLFEVMLLSTEMSGKLLVSSSQLTSLSLPCLYIERTLRDNIISSAESTRCPALARAEKRDGERGVGDRWVALGNAEDGESPCCSLEGSCSAFDGGVLGRDVGALAPSSTKLICLLRLFAFLPPSIMLPRFEKEIWAGEVKSSKLPVGMTMSMPWKGGSLAPLESSEWLRDPTTCSSWTTMAGRLGVRRRLVGVEGSLLFAVQFEDVRAESRRSSSSASICVRRRADALGPGLVRGRRTLLSQPRVAGPFNEGFAAFEGASAEGN